MKDKGGSSRRKHAGKGGTGTALTGETHGPRGPGLLPAGVGRPPVAEATHPPGCQRREFEAGPASSECPAPSPPRRPGCGRPPWEGGAPPWTVGAAGPGAPAAELRPSPSAGEPGPLERRPGGVSPHADGHQRKPESCRGICKRARVGLVHGAWRWQLVPACGADGNPWAVGAPGAVAARKRPHETI